MELSWTPQEVLDRIRNMQHEGESLHKRQVKKSDPELLRHAMYYYPSWEHACKECGISF